MNDYFTSNQRKMAFYCCSSYRLNARAKRKMRIHEKLNQTAASADEVCRSGEEMVLPGPIPSSVSASPHPPQR